VGTRVRVQVSRVDLDGRKIDFRVVREGEGGADKPPSRSDKPRPQNAAEELAAVREADRITKLAKRSAKAGKVAGNGANDGVVQGSSRASIASSSRSRKPGPQRATPRARTRR
jgi:ribonuclease R